MFVIFVSAKGQPDDGQGQQCCPIFQGKPARGCGFVKYFHREMAMAAINVLNGIYTMKGCDQPLIVRFADPKRPRAGDPRASPAFGVQVLVLGSHHQKFDQHQILASLCMVTNHPILGIS